jgi:hypothetical protein
MRKDEEFEQGLTSAVTDRAPGEPLIPALRREIQALVRHSTADSSAPTWRMIDASPALRRYEESMRLRHAEALATTITSDPELQASATASRAIARFAIDAYALAREAADPGAALEETFRMIEAAWDAACTSGDM